MLKEKEERIMEKKAILFDLDGTLTDSGEGIIKSFQLALGHFALPIPSQEELRVVVGPPLNASFLRFGVEKSQVEEAIRVFRSRYTTVGKFENTPYPGIRELLEALVERGHRLYVATSKPEVMAVEILEHFDLSRYFDKICGASLDESRASKDLVIAYLLETCGKAGEMVMVGDTKFDILGAKAHGIPGVGVTWGYGQAEEMRQAGAAAIVDTPQALFQWLTA